MKFIQKTMAQLQPWLIFFFVLLPFANSTSFNFSSFDNSTLQDIKYHGDAFRYGNVIYLTKNKDDRSNYNTGSGWENNNTGWATYAHPVKLYDSSRGALAQFSTKFSFVIDAVDPSNYGDGLAFFLAPFGSTIPENSAGGYLGLFNVTPDPDSPASNLRAGDQTVVVEFDSYQNYWDPKGDHIGINIGSIQSIVKESWNSSIKNGSNIAEAQVRYSPFTNSLSVSLTIVGDANSRANGGLSTTIDLKEVLPESVVVGFSASTGTSVEIHKILTWEFKSSLRKSRFAVAVDVIASSMGACAVVSVVGVLWFLFRKNKSRKERGEEDIIGVDDMSMDVEFAKGTGPKRFPYSELSGATNGFDVAGKLGQGGFGAVYKGVLRDSGTEVAIKRVSKGSKQGRKEYASEVKIISRLRHRNLVQLIGWCHGGGEFLLVYELMPNGSLDSHLFRGKNPPLRWETRYKIALGVASSLLYLHEEWEQCVVHRDIKSSNIMLDSSFNAKLGDFGLARLVDHGRTSQTTVLAGTMGYLAPECVVTGKANKESDVYSFGVVALEIACGRRPVDPMAPEEKVGLVEYVWRLYGRREMFEAADERLDKDFDEAQMERLMVVGLWCAHPDHKLRPTIRHAINVLTFEAKMPVLPSKMPVPTYYAPPVDFNGMSYATSVGNIFRN